MLGFKKSLVSIIAALGLVLSMATPPAHADTPSFNLDLTAGSLAGSTVSGFAADTNLSLTLAVTSGKMYFNAGQSTATLISDTNPGSTLFIQGTQAQIDTAFEAITFQTGCDGAIDLEGTLEAGGGILNEYNNHYYRLVKDATSFAEAKTRAAALTFDGSPTGTPGYLATITSSGENDFLFTVMGGSGTNAWIGGSDEETEGDWKWVTGPEAGTSFYSGNVGEANHGPVNGEFNGWNPGEPNQYFGDDPVMQEDYAEVYGSGFWNDIPSEPGRNNYYVVEWGGMPGDNFSTAVEITDTASQAGQVPFTGDGTQGSPYLVNNATDLSKVASCADAGIYFKQTADIDLTGVDYTPIGTDSKAFNANYDGDNFEVSGLKPSTYTSGMFGITNGATISNLNLSVELNASGDAFVGGLIGQAYSTVINNVEIALSGTVTAGSPYVGGLVGYSINNQISDISVSGSITVHQSSSRVASVLGIANSNTLENIRSTVDIVAESSEFIGGLFGEMSNTNVTDASYSGSMALTSVQRAGGMAAYVNGGTFYQVSVKPELAATNGSDFGGLVGTTYYANYTQVVASGDFYFGEANRAGGLFGYAYQNSMTDSFFGGTIQGLLYPGLLVGEAENNTLTRVHAIGSMSQYTATDGLFGIDNGFNNFEASFWVPDSAGLSVPVDPIEDEVANSVEDSQTALTYTAAGWSVGEGTVDVNNTWTMCDSSFSGTPFLSWAFPDGCLPLQTLIPTPSISGSGEATEVLTAVPGSWDDGVAFSYKWYVNGKRVTGATSSTFTPSVDQIGDTVTVKVVGAKSGFSSATSPSSAGVLVTVAEMTLTPTPVITGDPVFGETLGVDLGTWDADVELDVEWFVDGEGVDDSATITPQADQVGKTFTIVVTATKPGFSTVQKTSTGVVIGAATMSLTPTPVISGTAFGQTLSVDVGTWDADVDLELEWFVDGVAIANSDSETLTPTSDQVGKKFTVVVTATKPGYTDVQKTSAELTLGAASMVLMPTPTILGTNTVGQTLSVDVGVWDEGATTSIKWFVDGVEVSGETGASLTLTKTMAGKSVTVQVSAAKPGFTSISRDSDAVSVKALVVPKTTSSASFGGMAGNSWWMTWDMKNGVRKAVKANAKYTTLVCTGIVKAGGTKSWLKTLGLKRAEAGCWIAKLQNPKLKVSYKYVVAKPGARIQRGFTLTFSK